MAHIALLIAISSRPSRGIRDDAALLCFMGNSRGSDKNALLPRLNECIVVRLAANLYFLTGMGNGWHLDSIDNGQVSERVEISG